MTDTVHTWKRTYACNTDGYKNAWPLNPMLKWDIYLLTAGSICTLLVPSNLMGENKNILQTTQDIWKSKCRKGKIVFNRLGKS